MPKVGLKFSLGVGAEPSLRDLALASFRGSLIHPYVHTLVTLPQNPPTLMSVPPPRRRHPTLSSRPSSSFRFLDFLLSLPTLYTSLISFPRIALAFFCATLLSFRAPHTGTPEWPLMHRDSSGNDSDNADWMFAVCAETRRS